MENKLIAGNKPALLVMDYQVRMLNNAKNKEALLANMAAVIAAARMKHIPVIYIRVDLRPGYPEVSAHNKLFANLKQTGFNENPALLEIHEAVAPATNEVVITKRRVGAFTGTELDMVLRAQQIDTLLLAGISTSGVVTSTVRMGADLDYNMVVIGDCCSDADPELHDTLLNKLFPRQAAVSDSASVIKELEAWQN